MQNSTCAVLSQTSKFTVESNTLEDSYIKFLDEQIKLEARGPEWSAILSKRLSALKPYVGKPVVAALLVSEDRVLSIKIDPIHNSIIYAEEN